MTWSAGRRFRLTFVLAAGAALGVAAVACGGRTVDPTEMAATISAKITEQQPGIGTVTVTCPKGIDPVKGASFQCSYTGTSGTGGAVDVTMTDDAGTLSIRYPAPAGTVPISGGGFHAFDPGPDATAAPTDTTDPNASPGGDSGGFGTGSGSGGSGGGGSGSGQIGSSGGQVGSSGGFGGSGSGSGSGSDSGSGSSGQAPPAADNPDPVGHLGP